MNSRFVFSLAATMLAIAGCDGGSKSKNNNPPPVAPTVTAVTPAIGSPGVAVNATVMATFSAAMNASSLTVSTFTLASHAGAVAGTITYSTNSNMATFTPSASLAYNTQYTVTITTGATDSAGNALAANYSWSFTTAAAPPPTVTAETPALGATGVSASTTVTATFSEAMDATTLNPSTFTLMDSSGNAVAGNVSYETAGSLATFTPSSTLAYATQYTASVTTGAANTSGTALTSAIVWQFTTEAAPAAPVVTSTTPTNGTTGVAVNSSVVAIFSEAMNPTTFSSATFILRDQGGGSVAGTLSYSATNSAEQFTPFAILSYGTTYTAIITTGVKSTSGQALASSYLWSFTTVDAPSVQSTTPVNGATSAPVDSMVTATFSQVMTPATLNTSTFTLTSAVGSLSGTVTYSSSSNMATFIPSASLAYDTVYRATIATGAMSSSGIPLASNYSWSFSTEAVPSGMVTVDYGTKDQIIRGFGGSTAWLSLTTQQATALFNPATGLGLSILRQHIDPKGNASNNWVTSNWTSERMNAQEAQAANPNTIVFASPYTPPPSMKTSSTNQPYYSGSPACNPGPGYCGGYLNPSSYQDYANYLEDFVNYMAAGNPPVNLYGISMANEPDYSAKPGENYESCSWTAAQMDTWIANNGSVLTTKLIMPESYNFSISQSQTALNDESVINLIGIIGEHLYGVHNPLPYYTQAVADGKDVWMTEHYLKPGGAYPAPPTIADALAAAEEVHNAMVTGQYNAYVWWWIWDNDKDQINYGLMNDNQTSPTPTYYGYALGQFAKFIQPGYYRYEATANPYTNVYVSAYSGSEAGTTHYVIVAINAGSASVNQPFTIKNAIVTSMALWQTSTSDGLVQQQAVTVSDSTFTYTLPAQSITTFVQ